MQALTARDPSQTGPALPLRKDHKGRASGERREPENGNAYRVNSAVRQIGGDLQKLLFAVLSEGFWLNKSFGNSGILGVLRDFQNALSGQKIRPKPKRAVFRDARQ